MKMLEKLLEQLRDDWVFVEGKRDKEALAALGCSRVLTISGNLRLSCDRLESQGKVERVFVLTDLDRRGHQLADAARGELEARSIKADLMVRKSLGRILKIKHFEDMKRRYDEMKEESEKGRMRKAVPSNKKGIEKGPFVLFR